MDIRGKKWGVWGYGVVGKSVAQFLHNHGALVSIYDQNSVANTQSSPYVFYQPDQLTTFLEEQSMIVPSPGVDISDHYATISTRLVPELDLFYTFFKKPIIAITGSVGKTTITRIISLFLEKAGYKILTGGNIGLGMCDLLARQDECDMAVLELSSFQLEYIQSFAPFLAIITPFYPNHLDRHKTLKKYRDAKLNITKHQTHNQYALLPQPFKKYCKDIQSKVVWYSKKQPDTLATLFPQLTFKENMDIIAKATRILKIDPFQAATLMRSITLNQEHRLEHVATINGIIYINDSKATTPASTLAAVDYFKGKSIHLLLGGLSKGICREELIKSLQKSVKKVYCFGAEAQQLYTWCNKYTIPATCHFDLSACVDAAQHQAQETEIILLSPGGSSYDLFKNYEERGNVFKAIVADYSKIK